MTRQLNTGGPIPAEFRALAERAIASGTAVDLAAASMALQPPTPGKPRWRVRYMLDGKRAEVGVATYEGGIAQLHAFIDDRRRNREPRHGAPRS